MVFSRCGWVRKTFVFGVLNPQTWRRRDDHVECDSSVAFRVATGGVAKTSGKKGGGRETDPCALQSKSWWLGVHGKMTESYMKTRVHSSGVRRQIWWRLQKRCSRWILF